MRKHVTKTGTKTGRNRKAFLAVLLWCLLCGHPAAQSPGGVGNPELWFQTVGTGGLWTGSFRWQDFSGDSLRLNVYDSRGAAYGEEYTSSTVRFYNGHPALGLDRLLDLKSCEVQLKRAGLSQATVIGVFAPSAGFESNQLLYGLNGREGQGIYAGTDKVYPSRESGKEPFDYGETEGMDLRYSSGDSEPDADAFRAASMRIATYYRTVPASTGVWGERNSAVLTFNTTTLLSNINQTSSFNIPLPENRQFTGYIPEIIAYNRLLTPLERRIVESYLAIKYGISLPVSYLGRDGQLLWDCEASGDYNHRITALYRDDRSGLLQTESATSYEEKPRYTDQAAHDYFYLANSNNRSSESRLLVAGREDGNSLADGQYLFWGDNSASTTLNTEVWQDDLRRMNRQWTVRTNIVSSPRPLSWKVDNLEFKEEAPFIVLTKIGGNSAAVGTALTSVPLSGQTGYLGVSKYVATAGLTLRFGAQTAAPTAGAHDYGYFIDADFRAYKMESGARQASSFALLVLASSLEVEKTEGSLFLRVNGIRLPESEIAILPDDRNRSFYGAVSVDRGLTDVRFNLRHGGFTDTGNRVELSYACAPDFARFEDERGILVIDRSGTGEFRSSDLECVPVSEVDLLRKKLVFHDVFFDRDGNGTDAFTFALGSVEIVDDLQIDTPVCGQTDGGFSLGINWGVRGYNYVLKEVLSGQSVREGWEGSPSIRIEGLPTGDYELTVSEAGGYTFEASASSGGLLRAKTTNFLPAIDGNIAWRVSGTSATYTIGYTASTGAAGSSNNVFHYGMKQSGNKLYKVENGKETQIGSVTLQTGDEMKIVKGLVSIGYYRNGTQVGSSTIRLQDYGLSFSGLIDFGTGPAELLNANAEGFFNLVDFRWDMTEGVTATRAGNTSKKYKIASPECQLKSEPGNPTSIAEAGGENGLRVVQIPGTRTLRISLTLETAGSVSILVYDLKGLPAGRQELSLPQSVQSTELTVPQAGVYIVKAFTADGREYGQKTVVH